MNVPAGDTKQEDQPVENSSVKLCRHASTPNVDTTPSTGFDSTSVDVHGVTTFDGILIYIAVSCLGERLPPMSFFSYYDRYPRFFDASRSRHGVPLSAHIAEIHLGGEPRLTWGGGG